MNHHPIWKEYTISTTESKHSFNLSRCHFIDRWGPNSTTFQIARERKRTKQKLSTCHMSHYYDHLYQQCSIISKLSYPLLASSLIDRQIGSIHKIIHPSVIAAKGFNRNWPILLRYRNHKYCGLEMLDLKVE